MSELYGDAFKDDKREERLYGDDVTESTTTIVFDSSKDLPESKSNNVSFMKVEDIPLDCRNVLAVSETHICYSVTQKKNLLRIIDTQLGEKVILRGHENSVHDLRFAASDSAMLCSVDSGEGASKPHTIVWKKQEQGDWKVHAELGLRASMVRPHPVQADLWLVAGGRSLGIFSARASPTVAAAAGSYESLPLHLVVADNETIVDATFSSSGKHIAVAVNRDDDPAVSHIRIFKVDEGQGLLRVQTLRPLADFSCPTLKALRWTHSHIVTASARQPTSGDTVSYQVDMWYTGLETKDAARSFAPPLSMQTLTLVLPRATAGAASSALANPTLECALSLEPRAERYLLLSSRRSSLVACLALNPHPAVAGQPIYHVTCLNLRAPVVSADVITVLGQAHHSAEAGEHLEVSAYQEAASDAGQASIQQYHVLFAHLFSFAAYSALPGIKAKQSQEDGRVDSASAGGMIPLSALLEGSPTKQRIKENSNLSAAAEASNSKGMTILNMLNSMQRSTSNGSLASASAATTPSALPSPGIVRPQPSSASPATPAASNAAAGKLLGLLNSGSSKKNTTEAQNAVTSASPAASGADGLPAFLLNTQPALNSSILDVLKAASAAKAGGTPVTSSATAAPSTPSAVRPAVTTPAAASPAQTVTPQAAPVPVAVAPKPVPAPAQRQQPATVEPVKPTPIRPVAGAVVAPVAVKASTAATASVAAAVTVTPVAASVGGDRQLELLTAAVRELQLSVASIAGAQQQQQGDAQGAKALQQAVRELQAGQSKQSEQLLAAVRKAMEGEAKRALDHNTASSGNMRVEMSEQIVKELVPSISSKVRDSVRDTVRDSLKAQLPAAFRESFESGMLPAFEAGAQSMFQQLQAAFVQGMQGVMQEGLRVQSAAAASNEKLEQEVRDLRETVGRLEGSVVALSATVQSLTHSLASVAASGHQLEGASPAEEPVQDAFSLLREGRISEAVCRVLEDKDIAVTVSLLELLTPGQVAASCSHLERLCITQQLAADMSVNIPIEGIGKRVDWIKNLVLSLLSGKAGGGAQGGIYEDPNYEAHFKTMISVVLDSISAAKKLIFSAQYDTGEDDALSNLQVPHSVGTDLQLLEYVIQSKM